MSRTFLEKLIRHVLPGKSSTIDLEFVDELDDLDSSFEPSPSTLVSSDPYSISPDDSEREKEILLREIQARRSSDTHINYKKLPEDFIEALCKTIDAEEDPYAKLILYSHIVCGTKIDVLRERFILNGQRGKVYIASREFVRGRLNKSLDTLREKYYEINGENSFISTLEDPEEPYRAEFSSGSRRSCSSAGYSDTIVPGRSQSIGDDRSNEEQVKEEFDQSHVQANSIGKEKRTKRTGKKVIFVLEEDESSDEDIINGVDFAKDEEIDLCS